MGAIEDTRKVLQDFFAPELRAISARLDALEKRLGGMESNFDQKFATIQNKFENVVRRVERRHDEVMSAIRQVIDLNAIQQRPAILESKQLAHQ